MSVIIDVLTPTPSTDDISNIEWPPHSEENLHADLDLPPSTERHSIDSEYSDSISGTSIENEAAQHYGHRVASKISWEEPERKLTQVRNALAEFWLSFSAVLFSPVFFRHRNVFFLCVEVFVPGIIILIIFAAFTNGLSWKMAQSARNEAYTKILNHPEISMEYTMEKFRETHTDSQGKVLLMYTPVNNITNLIMQHTMEQLGLHQNNRLFRNGQSSSGVVGMNSEMEMIERAMFHRKDFVSHGLPAAVKFRVSESDKSEVTGMPYNIVFSLCLFDEAIHNTADTHPFIEPADTENWQSPYVTSGFIGLQYAIERSIIRLILEVQMEVEMKELEENSRENGRSLGENEQVDPELFAFMDVARSSNVRVKREEPKSGSESQDGKIVMRRRMIKSARELPDRQLKMFTYNGFGSEDYRKLLTFVVTCSCVVSYAFMSLFIVRQIARENLSGIKDILTIHGLPHYIHWALLLLHALVFRLITSLMVLAAWKLNFGSGSLMKNGSTVLLFFLIYFHQLALTFMNFFIAICVRSVSLSGMVAVTTCILSFYLPEKFYEMELLGKYTDVLLAMIFPNWCFRHAMRCLVDFETDEKGASWSNLFEVAHVDINRVSIGGGLLRLMLMMTVYYCLAAYIDMTTAAKLFPQTFKWYQFRKKARQREENRALHEKLVQDIDAGLEEEFEKPPVYEEPSKDKKCFVHIRNLCKNYGKYKVALDHVNMNIMHEEVTVILGHSGCGKSTLISTLAGLIQPTDGYAIVKGFDVQFDATKAREYIGMCPQKLVAFNLLNVLQHVKLCYRLRGYTSSECEESVHNILIKLRLWKVRTYTPSSLTNDELRRLGMAMALATTPKVLLLDQPTYGMDSIGRKEMWDIIHTLKRHHTIVIATNFMDEAEQLADRLAFMAHGRLICYGTLPFLEAQYDTGYFLKIQPIPKLMLDSMAILNLVKSHLESEDISTIRRRTRITEVDSLVLGLPDKEKAKLAALCDDLEDNMTELNILRYSIRKVNLNDVFIRICNSVASKTEEIDFNVRRNTAGELQSPLFAAIPRLKENDGPEITVDVDIDDDEPMSQKDYLIALLKKRWTVMKSGGYSTCFRFIIPFILVGMVVFQAKIFVETSSKNPGREMTINTFKPDKQTQLFYRMGIDDPTINYGHHISRILGSYGVELGKLELVINKMYEVLGENPSNAGYVKDDHMVAFEFRRQGAKNVDIYEFIGYFASGSFHSPPLALSLMSNVYLSAISAGEWPKNVKDGRTYRITTVNDPMPMVKEGKFEKKCGVTCVLLAVLMSVSISFMSHYCFILPMMERAIGMKHLQLMCGVPSRIYWFADYVVDCGIMFAVSCVIIILFLADFSQTFLSAPIIFSLWLICILYLLWSGIMYAYFMSTVVSKSMNGHNVLTVVHIILGIIPMLWFTLYTPVTPFLIFLRNSMEMLFPPYTITAIFHKFFNIVAFRDVCRGSNPFVQEFCDVRSSNPHPHTINTGHYISERKLYNEINKNDPKFSQCCDRVCLVANSCWKPPGFFNIWNKNLEYTGFATDCLALFLQGFIYCGLLIISDRRLIQRLIQKCVLKYIQGQDETDVGVPKKFRNVRRESIAVHSDVMEEKAFPRNVALVCLNLTKSTASKMIIKNFCLEVKKGQCIAILGRGDAGKTCVVKMIAGHTVPTKGNCYIDGSNLYKNRKKYLSSIGYSPQTNCLYPELTAAQMLELMGRLRGIPQKSLNTHIVKWLEVMGLSEVAQEQCKEYGSGLCSRLRAAMAFIGEPQIILLDEPTSSVDPNSREKIWSIIDHLNQQGHTIIFTTINTDEAFTIAEKVVVVADGSVQTIGDPDQLQKAYGRGHTIMFKLKHDVFATREIMQVAADKMKKFKLNVQQTFRFIDLLDEQREMIMYFLRDVKMTWREVHRRADFLTTVHPDIVEYYEVSEGEVEDIFVFTNKFQELGNSRKSDTPAPEFNTETIKGETAVKEIKKAQKRLKRVNF